MKSLRENIIRYGICLLFILLPLIYSPVFASPHVSLKTFLFYGLAELIFAFWAYSLIVDKSYRLSKKHFLFFIPPILYVLWMSIAGIFAVNPGLSLWSTLGRGTGLLTLYHSLAISFVGASLIKKEGLSYFHALLKSFLLGAFAVAISVWFGNEGFGLQYDALVISGGGGLMGNSSLTAGYLIFPFFFGIYLLFTKSISRNWKIFISIIMATILFCPLFVNIYGFLNHRSLLGSARGATLGIISGLGVTILGYLALSKNKIVRIFGIITIFISLAIFSIGWAQLVKPDTTLHNKFIEVASGTRFIFWNVAQEAINKHPYFGYGPENYMIAFQENFNPKILKQEFGHEAWDDRAHNVYFDIGVSGGYMAIVFYVIFLLSILYATYRAYKKNKISQLSASALFGLVVAYVFQNLFYFDSTFSIMAIFVLSGGIYSLQFDDIKEKFSKVNISFSTKSAIIWIISLILIICSVFFCFLPLKKSKDLVSVMYSPMDIKTSRYGELLGGSPVGNHWDVSNFANIVYIDYKNNMSNFKKDDKKIIIANNNLNSYLQYLESISKENKSDYRLHLSILRLYNTQANLIGKQFNPKQLEHVLSVANYAHTLAPTDPQVYWNIASLDLWQGDIQGSLEACQSAITLDSTNETSWQMMMVVAKSTGVEPFYDAVVKEAQKNIPDFTTE